MNSFEKYRLDERIEALWESCYQRGDCVWRSAGLSDEVRALLSKYRNGPNLLEVGCGTGDDSLEFAYLGYDVTSIDLSKSAIEMAESNLRAIEVINRPNFIKADFATWYPQNLVDIVYEKGVFHNLAGPEPRSKFIYKTSKILNKDGIWFTISGSADNIKPKMSHGAVFLRDIIEPVEVYFEVLEVVKSKYNLADSLRDFDAWHCIFRRR